MHRSGTSLLARLLSLAGVDLGADADLAQAASDNPRGFYEHTRLREVNDALLQAFGGSWTHPPELPENWLQDPRVAPIRARAREILEQDFAGRALWGFKDPRASLLADFWREILPGRVAWIVAMRNPLDVAASLQRRNGMPLVLAEDLWNEYTRAALRLAPAEERAILHYERLLEDPAGEIARLIATLRLPVRPPARDDLENETEVDLRHHRHGPEDVASAPGLRRATQDLYLKLWQGQDPGPLADQAEELGFRQAFRELRGAYGRLLEQQETLRHTALAREAEAERHRLDLAAARAEVLQLRHEQNLLRRRAEYRMGERLRLILRQLRPRSTT